MTSTQDIDSNALWAGIEAADPKPWARQGSESVDSDEAVREEHARRRTFIAFYGYAVPTREAVRAIAGFFDGRSVVEVCAGQGLWARLLRDEGVSVVATDESEPQGAPYVCVERRNAAAAIAAHGECDALLICWPPDRQPAAAHALRCFGGDRLVYVGDERFTGSAAFHGLLSRHWRLQHRLALPSWPGIEDSARFYVRRPSL